MYNQPMYYNPSMQNTQQRLQMMENQYPQFSNGMMGYNPQGAYQQPSQQTPSAAPIIKGRPVSNEEEANAAMIDFDGSLFIFPDKGHGKIYTKQLGLDGNIIFQRYSLDQTTSPMEQPKQDPIDLSGYAKQEDLEKVVSDLKQKIAKLEQRLSKGGSKE